ncbi:MAG: 50S ribosomal protein L11 methyltransferase [Candidatus Sumerlaeaceae bacterium]|nr:50S ribosomal protein L11 methyltransferase [Candidatus Sumerlaeaceae bacterium]
MTTDRWTKLRICAPKGPTEAHEELLAAFVAQFEGCGLAETDTHEGREWQLYFEEGEIPPEAPQLLQNRAREAGLAPFRDITTETVERENWHDGWRQYFKPVQVSRRIWVAPPWETESIHKVADTVVLVIEPGMAFGTGTHATTQLCLSLLETVDLAGRSVLDVGTGSGILAIACIKLGAKDVVGVDNDPDVEENFGDNLRLNSVGIDQAELQVKSEWDETAGPFDVIVCNMLSREFLPLLPKFPDVLARNGVLVLSGFLKEEQPEVESAVKVAGFETVHHSDNLEWAGLVARRRHG